jgi:hypothetical protein
MNTSHLHKRPMRARILELCAGVERVVELSKLNLGQKPQPGCIGNGPATPLPKVWYPSLWIEASDAPIELPDTGKAVIDYKVTRKSTSDTNGKKLHEARIEVHSIEPVESGKEKSAGKGKKLAGAAKVLSLPSEFSACLRPGMIRFSRARNGDGEFAPQAEGVPDPNTMVRAYGPPSVPGTTNGGAKKAAVAGVLGASTAAALLARKLKTRSLRVAR